MLRSPAEQSPAGSGPADIPTRSTGRSTLPVRRRLTSMRQPGSEPMKPPPRCEVQLGLRSRAGSGLRTMSAKGTPPNPLCPSIAICVIDPPGHLLVARVITFNRTCKKVVSSSSGCAFPDCPADCRSNGTNGGQLHPAVRPARRRFQPKRAPVPPWFQLPGKAVSGLSRAGNGTHPGLRVSPRREFMRTSLPHRRSIQR